MISAPLPWPRTHHGSEGDQSLCSAKSESMRSTCGNLSAALRTSKLPPACFTLLSALADVVTHVIHMCFILSFRRVMVDHRRLGSWGRAEKPRKMRASEPECHKAGVTEFMIAFPLPLFRARRREDEGWSVNQELGARSPQDRQTMMSKLYDYTIIWLPVFPYDTRCIQVQGVKEHEVERRRPHHAGSETPAHCCSQMDESGRSIGHQHFENDNHEYLLDFVQSVP